jgi:hypothetical protein
VNRYVDLGSPFADLDPTPDELAALAEVMAELGDYPPGYDPPPDEDLGPWDDGLGGPALAYEMDLAADPAEIGALLDLANTQDAQRLAEDELELPVKAEDRIAHLLDRASRHTYTPPAAFRDATDLANGDPGYGCGIYDADTGRCTARYHLSTCMETVRGSAATGNHEAASRFKDALLASTATAVELATAHRYTEGVDDWLADPGPTDQPVYQAMREVLGLSGRQHRPEPMRPAAQITPAELGVF